MGNELIYQIALTKIPLVGTVLAKSLISYCGSVEAIFHSNKRSLLKIPGIGTQIAKSILSNSALDVAERELNFLEQNQVQTFFLLAPGYPERLRHLPDAPLLLYYKGSAGLNPARSLAIVGTRQPTSYGRDLVESILEEIAPFQPMIISGLAYGIDALAHQFSLSNTLPTVGVLGHGLDRIYPAKNRSLALRMTEAGGLLTEFSSGTLPDREHFPMRNRVVAGLCDGLLVVESGRKGGSMITANLANGYHKDVFAVPGPVGAHYSQGCNLLIKSHKAALVESGADIAYQLGWSVAELPAYQTNLFPELNEAEQMVLQYIRESTVIGIDQLSFVCRLPSSQLAPLLLSLECHSLIEVLPGKRYQARLKSR